MIHTKAYIPPPRTAMEVFKMLPEGTRCELINGIIYMSPAPLVNHQEQVGNLAGKFYNFIQKKKIGRFLVAPVDVYLDQRKNAFQPDLIFILNDNLSIVKDDGVYGTPDLVIEILSPGTKNFDLTKKKTVYEKSGVKEYWAIDPVSKLCTGYKLVGTKFNELPLSKGKFNSPLLKQLFTL